MLSALAAPGAKARVAREEKALAEYQRSTSIAGLGTSKETLDVRVETA